MTGELCSFALPYRCVKQRNIFLKQNDCLGGIQIHSLEKQASLQPCENRGLEVSNLKWYHIAANLTQVNKL